MLQGILPTALLLLTVVYNVASCMGALILYFSNKIKIKLCYDTNLCYER